MLHILQGFCWDTKHCMLAIQAIHSYCYPHISVFHHWMQKLMGEFIKHPVNDIYHDWSHCMSLAYKLQQSDTITINGVCRSVTGSFHNRPPLLSNPTPPSPPPSIDYLYRHHSQASWFHLMSRTIHTPHIQHAHCTLYYCDKITLEHTCRHMYIIYMCTCTHTCMAMDISISAKDTLVGCCCDPVSSWYHLSMLVYSPGFLLLWASPSWYPCPESACQ